MSESFEVDPSLNDLVQAAAQAVQDDHRDKRARTDDFNHEPAEEIPVEALPAGALPNDDLPTDDPPNGNPPTNTAASDGGRSSDSLPTNSPNTAVLFREAGPNARKYSRPPIAKMFQSLELVPENFLKLQNDAKAWILDPAHPERRDIIGEKRMTGGQDLARIRLWSVVEKYLKEGAGEHYFGHAAVTPGFVRTIFWPEDSAELTRQMMPLMRKMVTNERQRVYAAESRKEKARIAELNHMPPMPTMSMTTVDPAMHAMVSPAGVGDMPTMPPSTQIMTNIVRFDERGEFKRMMPRFNINPDVCTSVAGVVNEIKSKINEPATTQNYPEMLQVNLDVRCNIKVWTQDGLTGIETDADWLVALLTAEGTEWMDGEVRILVIV